MVRYTELYDSASSTAKMAAEKLTALLALVYLTIVTTSAYYKPEPIDSPCDSYRDRLRRQPNIIYIMADDLGWNDVEFHNSKVKTPHLMEMKKEGIELTQAYVSPICSPSRSAFMTGKYPSNNGLSLFVIFDNSQSCLPIEHVTIFDRMKSKGYDTKYVGKWHLGYCNETCLPLNRGVDEFRGVLPGDADYFDWTNNGILQRWINDGPSNVGVGTHMTVQDKMDVEDIIMSRKGEKNPFFMWVTPTAPHAPLQVTDEQFNVHDFLNASDVDERKRREFLGLVSAVDDIVGATRAALKKAGLDDNTVIVFSSDNGGENIPTVFPGFDAYANNYPLRMGKYSFTEGGVRSPTLYYDPRLHPRTMGTERDFLMHLVDWMPTFVQLGSKGLKTSKFRIPDIDGKSQVANLGSFYNEPDKRKYNIREELLVALTTLAGSADFLCSNRDAAFRWRDYKLIYGVVYYLTDPTTIPTEWPKPQESPDLPIITGADCHREVGGERVVRCLFNVIDDPNETVNLYDDEPEIVELIIAKLQEAKNDAVRAFFNMNLGVNNVTAERYYCDTCPDYTLIPRTSFCNPAVHSPLAEQYDFCL